MSKIKNYLHLDFYQVVADIEETYNHETRVEECHGEHTFDDSTLISQKIVELKIVVGDEEIHILDRLTPSELQLLLNK